MKRRRRIEGSYLTELPPPVIFNESRRQSFCVAKSTPSLSTVSSSQSFFARDSMLSALYAGLLFIGHFEVSVTVMMMMTMTTTTTTTTLMKIS